MEARGRQGEVLLHNSAEYFGEGALCRRGEDLREGIRSSWEWLGQAGKAIVLFIVSALPLLVIPAVLVMVMVLLIRHNRRKKRKNPALHQTKDVKVDN